MVFDLPELYPRAVNIHDRLETLYDHEVSGPIPLEIFPFVFLPNDPNFSTNFSNPPYLTHHLTSWLFLPTGQGDGSQIARNDRLFQVIMRLAGIPSSQFSRNTTHPDFAAFSNGVPIFIAEEKEGDLIVDVIGDIQASFRWIPHYVNLPFFVAFAVTFTTLSICIIPRTDGGGLNYQTRNIVIADNDGRLQALRRVIHVALLKFIHNHNHLIVSRNLQIGH